jgi:4-amino-4-deoxy-L-arabinose transferase-like glycosyltransferase
MTATEQKRVLSGKASPNAWLWISAGLFLASYLAVCIVTAASTPLWMDEVLTVWIVRLPSASRIYNALAMGAQFSPPAYHLALHYLSKLTGAGYLAMRAPSIAAIFVTGFCSFVLFRRYLGAPRAMFACCLLLRTLLPYAVQARPYAIVTCCFAASLLLWDGYNRLAGWWRCAAIGLLLALAISVHIYSALLLPCLGCVELFRTWRTRQFRPPLWIALVCAAATVLFWLPLIHALSLYNSGDTASPAYYAKPVLSRLIPAYQDLVFAGPSNIILLIVAMSAIAAARFCGSPNSLEMPENSLEIRENKDRRKDFWTAVFGAVLLPLIVFAFSIIVTRTFEERYVASAAIGMSALVAGSLSNARLFGRAVPLLVLLAALLTAGHSPHYVGEFDRKAVFQRLSGSLPIVVADGLQFCPLIESAPPDIRSRLVYLTLPPGVQAADPTNEHQIERWKAIDPSLPVESAAEFLKRNPEYYVLDTRLSDDTLTTYLLDRHLIDLASQANHVMIYKSHPLSTSDAR